MSALRTDRRLLDEALALGKRAGLDDLSVEPLDRGLSSDLFVLR